MFLESLYRSEEMAQCQFYLNAEVAYMCLSELGELGMLQLKDTVPETNAFHRKFVREICRCDEMERKLRFLQKEILKANMHVPDPVEIPVAPLSREMVDLEATLEKLERELVEVIKNTDDLKRSYYELIEMNQILENMQILFEEDKGNVVVMQPKVQMGYDNLTFNDKDQERQGAPGEEIPLKEKDADNIQTQRIEFLAGVINSEKVLSFEKFIWRACRGNAFLKSCPIDDIIIDPKSGDAVSKNRFAIFFQGGQLKQRVRQICEGYHATLYPCPDTAVERQEMRAGVTTRIQDLITVLNQTEEHRNRVLGAAAKNLKFWVIKVKKIKAIYHQLNLFNPDVSAKYMIGEGWCAASDLEAIKDALMRAYKGSNAGNAPVCDRMQTDDIPPTFNRTNKLTAAFQHIVDAYGVAKYQEISPTPFTVITFPFLFAVMFGDAGHGAIIFLFGLWMVLHERQLSTQYTNNDFWKPLFAGRYIILLMGAFSIYTGFIFNDVFSKSMSLAPSMWSPDYENETISTTKTLQLDPVNMTSDVPYPFGMDPIWHAAKNKITYTNSIKMKLSIILGLMHMLLGVMISLMNHIYFKDTLSILCDFLPQLLFLLSMFGYLVFLIFVKWIIIEPEKSACAPSLLITFLHMYLFRRSEPKKDCDNNLIPLQTYVQTTVVFVTVICVPWMLFLKPMLLYSMSYRPYQQPEYTQMNDKNQSGVGGLEGDPQKEPVNAMGIQFIAGAEAEVVMDEKPIDTNPTPLPTLDMSAFSEICIHQCIHTIEYCLGCVSNTASYLRLWALSLAHGQLSDVLWTMILRRGLAATSAYGSICLVFTFAIWAMLSVGVLLIMEGLSAFLHALRLHWVEFQNKFYSGSGYIFTPFTFEQINTAELDHIPNGELKE